VAANPARAIFVSGTDTGIGKTRATLALLEAFKSRGLTVAGMKPIASGCEERKSVLTNQDALAIQSCSSGQIEYADINPYAFAPPIAPHIAAARAGITVDPLAIQDSFHKLAKTYDRIVMEGVGGWRVPLSMDYSTVDLVNSLHLPVVLVVALRLGCINHALLSFECMQNDAVTVAGWIANRLDPDYGETAETIQFLEQHIQAPLLGILPFQPSCNAESLVAAIDISSLCD